MIWRSVLVYLFLLFGALSLLGGREVCALENPGQDLTSIGLDTKLGTRIDLGLSFSNQEGRRVALRDLMLRDKPTILVPAYYRCPRLCGLVLSGVADLMNSLTLNAGEDYRVITASFDPTDSPAVAAEKAAQFRGMLRNPEAGKAWSFLTGDKESIATLMHSIGFKYMEDQGEFAHTAAIMILTPDGEISQVFGGVQFSAPDVRLALVEASKGAIGNAIDHVMLFCYRFDPTQGRYTWAVFGLLRITGAVTLVLLGGLLWKLWRREMRADAAMN